MQAVVATVVKTARFDWRRTPVQAGILLTFAMIPMWQRLPSAPPWLPSELYSARFGMLQVMLATILWWLLAGLPGREHWLHDRLRLAWGSVLVALGTWGLASHFWAFQRAQRPEEALSSGLQLAVVLAFALVIAGAGPSARSIAALLVFGLVWSALVAVLQTNNQASIGLSILGEFPLDVNQSGVSVLEAEGARWLRPYGLLPHPNLLAGFLTVALLAAATWLMESRRTLRWLGTAVFLLGLWALLLTFSRAAWLGFAAGIFVMLPLLLRNGRLWQRVWALPVGLALLTGAVFAGSHSALLLARAGVGDEATEIRSVVDRSIYLTYGYRAIDENLLLGVGINNFRWRSAYYLLETDFDLRGDNVHQVFVQAWAELGIVGFGLTLAGLGLGIEGTLRGRPDGARITLLAGVLALTTIGLFDHYPWTLIQFQTAWWGLLAAALKPISDKAADKRATSPVDRE